MTTGIAVGVGVAVATAMALVPSWAQEPSRAPAGAVRSASAPATQEVQRRLRFLRALEITRALKLDGNAAGKVLAVFARTDDRRSQLFTQLRESRNAMTQLLKKKSRDPGAMQALVDSYTKARLQLAELNNEEFQELRGALSPEQQAKYLLAKRRFAKKVQQMLRQVRK